ncbi:NmrA family transcriptional regulator [Microdochium trichocladiopsis]|uniref:NmrA family transcriptional regulator n=1 Tax=Microdochium trichocladiopsis TaxID=1682393 RepID=A0A9P8XXU2_9PEZI|nr:NmrA family transcriptional regulator [Microdochium trichocladiopsis]KAH7021392.1 NmrA family transcriptional regulator [Microdochium trichocladiopsis]
MAKELLTVFGATGKQGGALIRHVLNTPTLASKFTLRGISRDTSKSAAQALSNAGVDMVQADLNDPSTLDRAVAGSHIVFAVTDYWVQALPQVEVAQGKAIADAAVAAGVQHLIWSSLPSISKLTDGRVKTIHHFDSKAEVETYIRGLDIGSIFFAPGWFMSNHLESFRPQPVGNDTYILVLPWSSATRLPLIDVRDTGKFLAPVLLNPKRYHGKSLTCATAYYSLAQMVEVWSKVTGKTVMCKTLGVDIPFSEVPEEHRPLLESLASIQELGYYGPSGPADLAWTLSQLSEKLGTWEDFVKDQEPWF